jgi:hypothetical protein
MTNDKHTDITIVLDRSGSMDAARDDRPAGRDGQDHHRDR